MAAGDAGTLPGADDFARVEAIFALVSPLDADRRTQAITEALPDRPDLRGEIEALLVAHDRLVAKSGPTADEDAVPSLVGRHVGAYRLVEKIGEGGMGDVFRAERADGLFVQQVAVKITRATLGDGDLRRRFAVERQILASLNHDNIVRLLDGGTTEQGQAFLIMEHVEGVPLTERCREGRLSLEDRLRLFCLVCRAVQYAHQHGVVHRDLKPANILVTADNIPKVVDFGVAKLLEGHAGSGFTTTGVVPGPLTPNYASPEQIRGLAVTTSSDVYALGVVLYEFVAGGRPYDTQGLPLERVIEIILHEQPPRPSLARNDPGLLPYGRARLAGDIDAIVLKAMSKEPGERYASASELASDIGRWLQGEPVLARAPSSLYVLRRLAWRHKRIAAVLALALAGVLTASGVATWQWRVARREQARAEQRFDEVRKLANSIIFKIHDAVVPLPGSTPVRQLIVNEAIGYLEQLDAESGDNIPLRLELAAAHRQIGDILGNNGAANLGDRDGAIVQYERALSLVSPLMGTNAPFDTVAAVVNADLRLAPAYQSKGDSDRSLKIAREAAAQAAAFQQREPESDRSRELRARANFGLAMALNGGNEGVAVWLQTLQDYEQMLAKRPDDFDMQRNVALVGKYLGSILEVPDPAAARKHYLRSLELDEKRLLARPDDTRVQFDAAISYSNVASIDSEGGHPETATPLFEKSLALRRQLVAADPVNAQARGRLAYLQVRIARHERDRDPKKARQLADEAIQILVPLRRVKDDANQGTLASAWYEVGLLEKKARRHEASCSAFRRSEALFTGLRDMTAAYEKQKSRVSVEMAACPAPTNDDPGLQ
jgi:eukaryotic-like serine/threonine-protein kinase